MQHETFDVTNACQPFIVPVCVFSITFDVSAGKGGDSSTVLGPIAGGNGTGIVSTIPVTPGDVLSICVVVKDKIAPRQTPVELAD